MKGEGDWVKFLGTAGARVVVAKQLRSSGGTWLHLQGCDILLDPGPGSLVRALSSKPKLDPSTLDAVILSHKHLDHSGDINVIIEAMTQGGFKKQGLLFAPRDALEGDPVVLKYLRGFLERIEILEEGGRYRIGDVSFSAPLRSRHPGEAYGLTFHLPEATLSFITDTAYFPELASAYKSDLVVINVVLLEPSQHPHIQHLCLDEAVRLIREIRPKAAVLTHFGMGMLRAKPWELATSLTREIGIPVLAARDGMTLDIAELLG